MSLTTLALAWSLGGGVADEAPPTFTKDIAPIIFNNCTSCHRPGEAAPFALMSYKDVRKRATMIERVVEDGIMPPWHPAEGHGEFIDEMFLSKDERDAITAWIDAKMPEGKKSDLPKMPKFVEGWQLGKPDLVVKMPKGYTVPAGGRDIYRNFVVPLDIDETKWITAIEVRPGSRNVLHHVLFSFDTSGEARKRDGRNGVPGFSGMSFGAGANQALGTSTSGLGGWAVGGVPRHLPMGLARELPAGADIVLQSHFHPSGKEEVEQTTLGIHFAKKPPERTMAALQLPPFFGIAHGLDIPAGKDDFELKESFTLPVDAMAVTVGGHAHYLCTEMQIIATRPDEDPESIFFIDEWDFDWQTRYQYAEPVMLPAGTKIDARVRYDNSDGNLNNPYDPPRRAKWGPESTDEMGSVTLLMVAEDESEADELRRAIEREGMMSMARSAQRLRGGQGGLGRGRGGEQGGTGRGRGFGMQLDQLAERVKGMDRDGDGFVTEDEVGRLTWRMVERMDTNSDGKIDADEIEAMKKGIEGGEGGGGGTARVRDLDGESHSPLAPKEGAHVLVFTTTDCPIANSYVPRIAELCKEFQGEPVEWFLVHVDPDTTTELARTHADDYSAPCPVLLDPKHVLAGKLEISITPEVAIVTPGGSLAYRGRIDNRYGAVGKKRQFVSRHDLRDALTSVLAGEVVETPRTDAVGCDLPVLPDGVLAH